MNPRLILPMHWLACVAVCAAAAGCAGLPRIDPTGERILIWPKDQPQVVALTAPPSTVIAPPVTTDPFFPAAPVVAGPAVTAAPGVTTASVALAQVPQDRVTITPERILAPVGSEVVLKAAVCTTEGYTLADQKVEWMLGRNGVGQFVEVSGKGFFHPPLLPWNKPKKIDNYLAEGWTATDPLCVTRGTADPADDVNILRGDAWISVTSPNEGTSYVTAYMPSVESWDQRKSAATIYWVDVQWTFPPPTVSGSGRAVTLTTTVTRQTNGTPIEGWLVRYALADGGGALVGGGAGQVVEMRTDARGQATVDVSPTASGAASSRIDVELVRPAGFGGGDAPRLVIGSGATVIQWSGGSTPYLPPSSADPAPVTPIPALPGVSPSLPTTPPGGGWGLPGTTIPPATGPGGAVLPTTPPGGGWSPPSTTVPPATAPGGAVPPIATAQPQLELELRGEPQAAAGGQMQLEMVIRNVGNAPATQVTLLDRLDAGLMYPPNPDSREVDFTGVGTVLPGETKTRFVPFNVMQAGRLCHNATVRCAEGSSDTASFCLTAVQPAETRTGHVTVSKDGPLQGFVGQKALFRITVRNDGQLPLTDVEVLDEYPPALLRVQPPPGDANFQITGGVIRRVIPSLGVGQSQTFEVECQCVQAARPVLPTPLVRVRASTDPPTSIVETSDDHPLEILPPRVEGAAPPGAATDGAGGENVAAATPRALSVRTTFFSPRARIGATATCQVSVVNNAATPDENIELRVAFPAELTPDVSSVIPPSNVEVTQDGDLLRFTPVAMLRPTERVTFTIPLIVKGPPGFADVVADVRSLNVTQGVPRIDSVEVTR